MNKIKKWMLAAILTICGTITPLTSCSNDDNQKGQQHEYTGVPLIIIDTDIGSSTDDLLAMMMLYRYQERDKCRLLGIVVDREGEDYAACEKALDEADGSIRGAIDLLKK